MIGRDLEIWGGESAGIAVVGMGHKIGGVGVI